ncbi:unnamed protein product, partial [Medioppia subpectinata]
MEMYWRDHNMCPTEEQYSSMVRKKTCHVFIGVKLMQLLSDCNELDLQPLIAIMSEYIQIRNDYQNLTSEELQKIKGFCEDFTEGKFSSFPIIHAIHSDLNDTTVSDILRMRTKDKALIEKALKKMQSLGSFEYTLKRLKQLDAMARDAVKRLGPNHMIEQALDYLLYNKK